MSSIPLAANNLKTNEQPTDLLGMYRAAQGIQQQQTQMQSQKIALQQAQQAQKDQQAHTAAINQWDVKSDPAGETVPSLVLKNGGSGDAALKIRQGILQQKEQVSKIAQQDAETGSKNLDTMQKKNDMVLGGLQSVTDGPDEGIGDRLTAKAQEMSSSGLLDPQHAQMAQQVAALGDPAKIRQALIPLEKGMMGQKAIYDQAKTQAETAKDNAQAAADSSSIPGKVAEGQIKQAEAQMMQQGGLTPEMANSKYLALQTKKNQGTPIAPPDAAFMKAYEHQKTLVPTANFNLQNAGATGTGGQPSSIAKGIADGSIKWNDAVSPRTPMNVKDALLAEVKSINPQFKSSDFDVEKKVQEKYTSGNAADQLTAINTSRNHMATFKTTADALDNGNFKLANQAGNWLNTEFGSNKTTNFNVARSAFAGEVGKAFAGANVGVADRQELIDKINSSSSFSQLKGYADTADELLAGKQKSMQQSYDQGKQGKPNFGTQGGGSNMIQARDAQGKLHQAPAGTPLPAGWKLEQ